MLRRLEDVSDVMEVFQAWCPVERVVFTEGASVKDGKLGGGSVMVVVMSTVVVRITTPNVHLDSAVVFPKPYWEELEMSLVGVAVMLSAESTAVLTLATGGRK